MPSRSRTRTPKPPSGKLDGKMVKAMAHPLRMQIMTRLDGKVASPRELAEDLGLPIPNVSYHVRVLRELELVELVSTRRSRGSTEHFYRGVERPFITGQTWPEIPPAARRSVSGVVIREIAADVDAALDRETFDARGDRHLSRVPLVLDQQGWDEVRDLLAATLDAILAIQAEASGRLVAAGAEAASIDAETALLFFERAPKGRRRRR